MSKEMKPMQYFNQLKKERDGFLEELRICTVTLQAITYDGIEKYGVKEMRYMASKALKELEALDAKYGFDLNDVWYEAARAYERRGTA